MTLSNKEMSNNQDNLPFIEDKIELSSLKKETKTEKLDLDIQEYISNFSIIKRTYIDINLMALIKTEKIIKTKHMLVDFKFLVPDFNLVVKKVLNDKSKEKGKKDKSHLINYIPKIKIGKTFYGIRMFFTNILASVNHTLRQYDPSIKWQNIDQPIRFYILGKDTDEEKTNSYKQLQYLNVIINLIDEKVKKLYKLKSNETKDLPILIQPRENCFILNAKYFYNKTNAKLNFKVYNEEDKKIDTLNQYQFFACDALITINGLIHDIREDLGEAKPFYYSLNINEIKIIKKYESESLISKLYNKDTEQDVLNNDLPNLGLGFNKEELDENSEDLI